jgi:hypothetical protein
MTAGIGLVAHRPQVILHVAAVAGSVGAEVVPLVHAGDGPGAAVRLGRVPITLVDVAATVGGSPGSPVGSVATSGLVVVHLAGESDAARHAAVRLGAGHVIELPAGSQWLADRLRPDDRAPVLAVLGAVGGAGATTVAIACAAAVGADCLLVDADPLSSGVDLPLGIDDGAAGRWSAVPDTSEPLVAESLRAALPVVHGITVVTGGLPDPPGGRIGAVMGVGRRDFARTVVDCGRQVHADAVTSGDAAVILTPATLAGVVGCRRILQDLPTDRVTLAIRSSGWLPSREVADELGIPRFVEVPRLARVAELAECGDVLAGGTGRKLRRLGHRIWGGAP